MDDFFTEVAGGFLYGAVGIILLVVGFLLIDLLTPGKLGHLIKIGRASCRERV